MSLDITNIVLQRVLKITAFDLADDSLLAIMRQLKDTKLQNTAESIAIESQGVEIAQFDTKRAFTLSGSQSIVTEGLLAMQTGIPIETVTDETGIRFMEALKISDDKAVTRFSAVGIAGAEIGWAYPYNPSNSFIDTSAKLEQGTVGSGSFSYSSATRTLTFDPSDDLDGKEIVVFYYPKYKSAKKITSRNDKFSKSALVEVDIAVQDMCTKEQYLGKFIIPNGKFSGAFDLTVDGTNPAVQNFEIKSQFDCSGSGELWRWFIYREDDIEVTP